MSQTTVINADTIHEVYMNVAYYMFYPTPIDSTSTSKTFYNVAYYMLYLTPIDSTTISKTFYHVAYYILAVRIIDHITILILLLIIEYLTTIDRRFYPYPSDKRRKRVEEMVRIRDVY